MRLRTPGARARAREDAVLRQAASILLGYPDDAFHDRLPLVRGALAELPDGAARRGLLAFAAHAADRERFDLCAHYVRTFDTKRRRALHMTFYTAGDTRRRGHELARVKEVYRGCGWTIGPEELPDHLAVVLEFTARGDAEWGQTLLAAFRPGLELLRAALHEHGTEYAGVVDAVCATLPAAGAGERAAAERLARVGPPAEDVGLEPVPAPGPHDLGMPAPGPPPATAAHIPGAP
ncbi:respiratory nitrate reductase chaperone NarJ [Murinocardiopsis flavida]|uniref:Respiratory nitrate reductase chaperone NarJ n=1 Tax=Murinocardiopsis flavida TaxID=645275 RepID=A0A2P8CUY3_9ACTN|nr:nitrate reductase molybdenum cofactor assembly chaperone [Murinocardiopsis flavida]PSK88767.1 respiratory nitrate reductase chaperone NarJ [Murinocardiopsis flavida]